jgi:restriction system protein
MPAPEGQIKAFDRDTSLKRFATLGIDVRRESLTMLRPSEFEDIVLHAFSADGWRVIPSTRGSDQGIDGWVTCVRTRGAIQCKHYSGRLVGQPAIRDFFGAVSANRLDKGFFVTSSDFTKQARLWVQGLKPVIDLINGDELVAILSRLRDRALRQDKAVDDARR